MKKSITIRIPEPCHEDWAKMTTTEKGKFCSVCTKEVFDFTSKTDEELVKILSKNKNACGRVKKSQLNREVKLERKSGQSFAPLAASMLLPLTLFSNNPKSEKKIASEKPMISMGIGRFSDTDLRLSIFTKGVVRDENGNPLKNVEIISNETKAQAWTNKNGEYEIYTLDKEWLTFSKENFEEQIIELNNKSEPRNIYLMSDSQIKPILLGKIAVEPENKIEVIKIFTKGNVVDDTGLPLPGANIIIKGTTKGTQTDFDGNYQIEAKSGDVLAFSYVGFDTKEITVSNIDNTLDINLDSSGELLGEMIVGGISWKGTENYQPPKDNAWKEKVKKASENTRAFEKIKRERKKTERKAKRNNM